MPQRYAEYVDPKNNNAKFYRVQWDETNGSWLSHYGRIGTKGSYQLHQERDGVAAKIAAAKKFKTKTKKGYTERKIEDSAPTPTSVFTKPEPAKSKPVMKRTKGRQII